MADFTPITTQEDLDRIIGNRLKEEKERTSKKYADYDDLKAANADLTSKLAAAQKTIEDSGSKAKETEKTIADLQQRVKTYETDSVKTRVALESGLPYEMAGRLRGETEDDIRKDAESLSKLMSGGKKQPMADPEPPVANKDAKKAAMKKMLSGLKGEE